MDKDHADSIAITKILDKLQIKADYTGKSKALYRCPISKEQKPRFWVYFKTNTWYDYTLSIGGDLRDFAFQYLKYTAEANTPADVTRWISNLNNERFCTLQPGNNSGEEISGTAQTVLSIKSAAPIGFIGLIRYLESLGIPVSTAQRFTKELKVFNRTTGRTFIALGVKNESDGYQLHNPLFNGFIHPGGITFFRGTNPKSRQIHVFKNIFDFLSVLAHLNRETWEHDTIILHESSNVVIAAPYIKNYSYKALYSWMDNDKAGRQAAMLLSELLKAEPALRHIKMNAMYAPHKNVSEWHRNNLPLKGI
ncbi:hypothetical protein DYBT9275_04904 [Dyadobacter sp. CECT 9275]|uniref:Toprim domain-containing protein n=1 Tax=Dyadobacter helix TaxID=2822344 RepID=A0A916NE10_9BACT|nr:toprim domain-containing protein [Dyadobacter sp. CECT 9275]CAG5011205.1 hypothetical protein DYBT9275_04904 [Dyadobacter sp. CECT 9275]